ncbi:MAG TPA: head GIN domain-containing protein [Sediminibacterium sp.]
MKHILLFLTVIMLTATSCRWFGYKRVVGNGNLETQDRPIQQAERIKLAGSYDVEITQGPTTSVKVEADENILPYILTRSEDGFLIIKSKDHISLSTDNTIKIFITTPKLEQVNLAGSGNIIGKSKFTGGDKLTLKIAGAGDMKMEVNTPSIEAEIAGSGSMTLTGETRDQRIRISGVGDYIGEALKSENAVVKIAGSGNVKLFAAATLDVNIAGVGSVYYKGSPVVKQHVAGSGEVKKLE